MITIYIFCKYGFYQCNRVCYCVQYLLYICKNFCLQVVRLICSICSKVQKKKTSPFLFQTDRRWPILKIIKSSKHFIDAYFVIRLIQFSAGDNERKRLKETLMTSICRRRIYTGGLTLFIQSERLFICCTSSRFNLHQCNYFSGTGSQPYKWKHSECQLVFFR